MASNENGTQSTDIDVQGFNIDSLVLHNNNELHTVESTTPPFESIQEKIIDPLRPFPNTSAQDCSDGFSIDTHYFRGNIDGDRTKPRVALTKPASFSTRARLTEHLFPSEYNCLYQVDNMDGAGTSVEDQAVEAVYQPLIPKPISPDSTASMLFIKNLKLGKEAFAGRASFPASSKATESSDAGTVKPYKSSASDPEASDHPDPVRMFPSPKFVKDPKRSLMSRALADVSTSEDHGVPSKVTPYLDSLISYDEQGDVPDPTKRQFLPSPTSSPREKNEEYERLVALSGISMVALDSHNTLVAVNGEQYAISNAELWLYPCEKSRAALPQHTQLMRPSFLASLRSMGPKKAIEAINGRRLSSRKQRTSPALIKYVRRGAGVTENEGLSDMLPLLLGEPSSDFTERSDELLGQPGSYLSLRNPTANFPAGSNFGHGSIDMDGGVERPAAFTLSPIAFTGSPSALSRVGSDAASYRTNRTSGSQFDSEWDHEALLKLTNSVRAALITSEISHDDLTQLRNVFSYFLADETSPQADENVGIALIAESHFDKLLEDLIGMRRIHAEYDGLITEASSLQLFWQQKFGTGYFLLDEGRFFAMATTGALTGLTLGVDTQTGRPKWRVRRNSPVADSEMIPGQWWLNMTCVYRDGIVDSTIEKLTTGKYGTPVLPILSGEEEDGPYPETYTWTFKGSRMDKHFGAVQKYGTNIKVLRGCGLKSRYAPKAGVRYDGEYRIESRVQLPHAGGNELYKFKIKLVRVPGQVSVNVLREIPCPSQMDKWKLYQAHLKQGLKHCYPILAGHTPVIDRPADVAPATDVTLPTEKARRSDVADSEWKFEEVFE